MLHRYFHALCKYSVTMWIRQPVTGPPFPTILIVSAIGVWPPGRCSGFSVDSRTVCDSTKLACVRQHHIWSTCTYIEMNTCGQKCCRCFDWQMQLQKTPITVIRPSTVLCGIARTISDAAVIDLWLKNKVKCISNFDFRLPPMLAIVRPSARACRIGRFILGAARWQHVWSAAFIFVSTIGRKMDPVTTLWNGWNR